MSKFGRLKRSTRISPGAALCCDCGFNTMPTGKPKPGTFEQFIVKDEVWIAAGMTAGKVDPKTYELIGGGFLRSQIVGIRSNIQVDVDGGGDEFVTIATINGSISNGVLANHVLLSDGVLA